MDMPSRIMTEIFVAAHLVEKALGRGLNLQTWTPVKSISESRDENGLWAVRTSRGTIYAPKVIHATNAYAGAILPELKDMIKPTPFMCTKVIPPDSFYGSNALQGSIYTSLPGGCVITINPRSTSDGVCLVAGVTPAQGKLTEYVATRQNQRIAQVDDSLGNFEPVNKAVESFLETELEGWKIDPVAGGGGKVEFGWSGIIGYVGGLVALVLSFAPFVEYAADTRFSRVATLSHSSARCLESRISGFWRDSMAMGWVSCTKFRIDLG
jgi:hypothetical protein